MRKYTPTARVARSPYTAASAAAAATPAGKARAGGTRCWVVRIPTVYAAAPK